MTGAEFAQARGVLCTETLRRALGLTQEEFAARFRIALGTLRNWELGRSALDITARAYLRPIAGDAARAQRALETPPQTS